jgi:hypothetical protein
MTVIQSSRLPSHSPYLSRFFGDGPMANAHDCHSIVTVTVTVVTLLVSMRFLCDGPCAGLS